MSNKIGRMLAVASAFGLASVSIAAYAADEVKGGMGGRHGRGAGDDDGHAGHA